MPHIEWKPRWKLSVISLWLFHLVICVKAQQMQEPMSSMAADGWRPIVGTRKDSPLQNQENKIKATPITTQGPVASSTDIVVNKIQLPPGASNMYQRKPIMKVNPFHGLPSRGGLVSLNAVSHGRPGYSGQIKHNPPKTLQVIVGGKRFVKPIRVNSGISGYNGMNSGQNLMNSGINGVNPGYNGPNSGHNGNKPGYNGPNPGHNGLNPGHNGDNFGHDGPNSGYNVLHSGYNGQNSGHNNPNSGHNGQNSGHNGPDSGHNSAHTGYNVLNSGYNGQNSGHNGQNSGHNGQNSGHNGPNSGHNGLNSGRNGPNSGHNGMNSNHNGMNSGANYNNNRDELFHTAASTGPYIPLKQVHVNNIKTRETLGLAVPTNHFSINQPHVDFGSRFPDFDFRTAVPQTFPKTQNNFHNELFRVNLAPPPLYKQEGIKKIEQYRPDIKPEPIQVQVTKEKLNVFHNQIPPSYGGDYFDYDFHNVRKVPTENSKPQTYEVTEKWPETTHISRPKPEVELKVPTFLPTPYKPEPLLPTSATQEEASTIFTELSKLQKIKAHKVRPNEYDIREVSTHYPILGKPEFIEQTPANEITTKEEQSEPQEIETTTILTTTTTTVPPRNKIHRRRRPLRYRTTTSTTTEEPTPEEEYYDFRKTQEEETSYEVPERTTTDTPRLRNRYRQHMPEQENEIPRRKPMLELYTEKPTTEAVAPSTSYEIVEVPTTTETPQTTVTPVTTTEEEELLTTIKIDKITTTPRPRIRGRPIKYDSTRPRFSVKDYRNKISSTTTEATTRVRSRQRRPTTSTTEEPIDEETQTLGRSRFRPKEPRHNTSIITDNNVKAVNTRLRPFGRQRTTSTTTPATKVSIKPNLFARKRPPILSLKARIAQKMNKTEEIEKEKAVTEKIEEEDLENKEESMKTEVTEINEEVEETTTQMMDILKTDDYSQRVSDLTSSFKDEYATPGLFKSVAPVSRKIPNHFTISTDDPILPIEAFFPGIKDRSRDQ